MERALPRLNNKQKAALERFPEVAKNFCRLVDGCGALQREEFLRQLAVSLAGLYAVAGMLPDVSPATEGHAHTKGELKKHSSDWAALYRVLHGKLGKLDFYWEMFDPTQEEKPVYASLSDDIADICLDLRESLALMKSGTPLADVHWQWRFDFRLHWGNHAVDALRTIHRLTCSDG